MVLALSRTLSCAAEISWQSAVVHDRRHPHVGPVQEAAAIMLQRSLELPIFSQNALMPFAGTLHALKRWWVTTSNFGYSPASWDGVAATPRSQEISSPKETSTQNDQS
jgi:hypothetical protein